QRPRLPVWSAEPGHRIGGNEVDAQPKSIDAYHDITVAPERLHRWPVSTQRPGRSRHMSPQWVSSKAASAPCQERVVTPCSAHHSLQPESTGEVSGLMVCPGKEMLLDLG